MHVSLDTLKYTVKHNYTVTFLELFFSKTSNYPLPITQNLINRYYIICKFRNNFKLLNVTQSILIYKYQMMSIVISYKDLYVLV